MTDLRDRIAGAKLLGGIDVGDEAQVGPSRGHRVPCPWPEPPAQEVREQGKVQAETPTGGAPHPVSQSVADACLPGRVGAGHG